MGDDPGRVDRDALIRLLAEVDGTLGLALHRREGPDNPAWKAEAEALIVQVRTTATRLRRGVPVDADDDEVRADERHRLADLLDEHGAVIARFASDPTTAVATVAYLIRLGVHRG